MKRVDFKEGYQRKFLYEIKGNLTWKELSNKVGVSWNMLSHPYLYEKCTLPYKLFKKLAQSSNLNPEILLEKYQAEIKEGIYPRPTFGETRKKLNKINISYTNRPKILEISNVNYSKHDKKIKIKLPKKLTPLLAEEIGIHIGDGFLSARRNEYRLKGNRNDEKEYYDNYIKLMYKKLYNLDLRIKEYETTYGFELASKALWEFKNKILKLPAGRKDNMDLPEIVKVNDTKILTSLIRGIFDTDGSVSFTERYPGFGKYYPTISLSLNSKNLMFEIYNILKMLGLEPKKNYSGGYWRISLNGYNRLALYSKLIGWSSPKHLNKVKTWKQTYPNLSMAAIV